MLEEVLALDAIYEADVGTGPLRSAVRRESDRVRAPKATRERISCRVASPSAEAWPWAARRCS
eukprot:SAG31_NODE_545_length_14238_cov_15.518849_6_plen_63_part_00